MARRSMMIQIVFLFKTERRVSYASFSHCHIDRMQFIYDRLKFRLLCCLRFVRGWSVKWEFTNDDFKCSNSGMLKSVWMLPLLLWWKCCVFHLCSGFKPWLKICIVHVFHECIVSIPFVVRGCIWWTNTVRFVIVTFTIIFVICIIAYAFVGCTNAIIAIGLFVIIWRISEIKWIGLPMLEVFIIICNSIHNVTSVVIVIWVTGNFADEIRCRGSGCFNFLFSIGISDIFIMSQLQR